MTGRMIPCLGAAVLALSITLVGVVEAGGQAPPARTNSGGSPKAAPKWTARRTAWGDPDISGFYLVATYSPLQRPERLKDKAFFTEDEAIAELKRVIEADSKVDPKDVGGEAAKALPPIEGYSDPPTQTEWKPDPPDSEYELFTLDIDDASGEDIREIWINGIRSRDHGRRARRPCARSPTPAPSPA